MHIEKLTHSPFNDQMSLSEARGIVANEDEARMGASSAVALSEAAAQEIAAQNAAQASWLLNDGPVGRQEARAALAAAQTDVTRNRQSLQRVTERVNMAHNTLAPIYRKLGRAAVQGLFN